ncbi:MAG TPA: hypothetical protein DCM51_04855 [Actinobacteria bacterium]|nr:hypothetical protein [Actinomycetota bacterium]
MDAASAQLLREILAGDPLLLQTQDFATALTRSLTAANGLLLIGTPQDEPWHLAAHLDDESRFSGVAALRPTLVRWQPPPGAPAHLAVGLERLERAGRKDTVFVVAGSTSTDPLLERIDDAKRIGARVVAMTSHEDDLVAMAHEALVVPPTAPETRALGAVIDPQLLDFDVAQHLVSVGAGQAVVDRAHGGLRHRLQRLIDAITGPD